jgi:hypothetical protein
LVGGFGAPGFGGVAGAVSWVPVENGLLGGVGGIGFAGGVGDFGTPSHSIK